MPRISKKLLNTLVEGYINSPNTQVQYGLEDVNILDRLLSVIKNNDLIISYSFIDAFIQFDTPNGAYSFEKNTPIFKYLSNRLDSFSSKTNYFSDSITSSSEAKIKTKNNSNSLSSFEIQNAVTNFYSQKLHNFILSHPEAKFTIEVWDGAVYAVCGRDCFYVGLPQDNSLGQFLLNYYKKR